MEYMLFVIIGFVFLLGTFVAISRRRWAKIMSRVDAPFIGR